MRTAIRYISILSVALVFLFACSQPEAKSGQEEDMAFIHLSVHELLQSRAAGDVGTATDSVNRIFVLPFQKLNPALPDNQADNFVPAWNFARQLDVSSFPVQSLILKLPKSFVYKVVIIGYKQADYDFYNPSAASNRIVLTTQPQPTTLANFQFAPKVPESVPELFVCYCTASAGSNVIGPVFTPRDGQDITLSGQLKRFVSGLGVYLTDIPGFVKSVTLVAGGMVKAIRLNDSIPVSAQTPGDGANRIIGKLIPAGGNVRFNVFLLPTLATYQSLFYLDIEYDSITERYQIIVPDSPVSQASHIILLPNGAVTITGSYSKINFGFEIAGSINLDDDKWDGITN